MAAGNGSVAVDDTSKKNKQDDAINAYRNAVLNGQITADEAYEMICTDRACLDFDIDTALREEDKLERLEKRYIKNVKKYCRTKNADWCKTTIYISGLTGAGKSNLADAFALRHCDARGFHDVAAKGKDITFDVADGYNMERVSVVNEAQGENYSVPQFLSIYDPKRASKAGSRNEDAFFAPEYVILNNSIPVETFIYDLCHDTLRASSSYYGGDPTRYIEMLEQSRNIDKVAQVRRRIAINCEIENGYLNVYYRVDRPEIYEHKLYVNKTYTSGQECFVLYNSMEFDKESKDCLNDAVTLIEDAIAEYYKVNDYSVNPLNSGWTWAMSNHIFGDIVALPNASDDVVSLRQDVDNRKIQVKETGYECTTDEFAENIEKMFDVVATIENILQQKVSRSATYGNADKFGVYSGVRFSPTIDGHYKIQYSFYDADLRKFIDTDIRAVLPDGTIEMLQNMGYNVFHSKNIWVSHFVSYLNKMFYRSEQISIYYKQHMKRFMLMRDRMRASGLWVEKEKERAERERLEQINAKIDAVNFHNMIGNI